MISVLILDSERRKILILKRRSFFFDRFFLGNRIVLIFTYDPFRNKELEGDGNLNQYFFNMWYILIMNILII